MFLFALLTLRLGLDFKELERGKRLANRPRLRFFDLDGDLCQGPSGLPILSSCHSIFLSSELAFPCSCPCALSHSPPPSISVRFRRVVGLAHCLSSVWVDLRPLLVWKIHKYLTLAILLTEQTHLTFTLSLTAPTTD